MPEDRQMMSPVFFGQVPGERVALVCGRKQQ